MPTENLKIRVTSDSSQAKRDMSGFDDKMKSTIKSVASLAAGMIALKKTYDFIAKSTKMAMEQEKIFNTLKNTVKITGEEWGNAKWELDRLFAYLQKTTIYGDTQTAAVFQKLSLLTGDYKTAMEGLPVVLDMAASGFFDLNSSARFVGMALTGNIEMLGRYFSEFKTANNEQLKSMTASEKAAYALDILKTKLKDLAAGELNTSIGAWSQFKNYWSDIQEAIGDKFIGTLGDLLRSGTEALQGITDLLRLQEIQLHETGGAFESMSETAQLALKEEKLALLEQQQWLEENPSLWHTLLRSAEEFWKTVKAGADDFLSISKALNEATEEMTGEIPATTIFDLLVGGAKDLSEEIEKTKKEIEELNKSIEDIPPVVVDVDTDAIIEFFENIPPRHVKAYIDYIFPEEEVETFEEHLKRVYAKVSALRIKIDPKYLEDQVDEMSQIWNTFGNTASSMFQTIMDDGFENIGEMWVNLIKRMAADLVASGLLKLLGTIFRFSTGGIGFFANIFHRGGEISNIGGKPVKGASGLDFTVPHGFPNDSFPILVESGEHVSVTPAGGNNRTDELLEALIDAINNKPVANTIIFDDIDMAKYVEKGQNRRSIL